MKDERVAAVRVDQPVFGAAAKRGDPRAGEPLAKIKRQRSAQVGSPRLDRGNAPALEHMGQATDGGFNFGKLGHARPYGEQQPSPLEAQPYER